MKFFKLCSLFLCVCAFQGCKTISANDSVAAVIPNHTVESITEIRAVIDKALHGTPVTIAKTAFNNSNKLFLERKKIIGPDGRVIQTRVDEEPIVFELLIIENTCFLRYLRTNENFPLKQAVCSKLDI